jgi:hypothetical protein
LWAGIIVGIVQRFHRNLKQQFMRVCARTFGKLFKIRAIWCQRERHGCWKLGKRIGGA